MIVFRTIRRSVLGFFKNIRRAKTDSYKITRHELHDTTLVHRLRGRFFPSFDQIIYFHKVLSVPEKIIISIATLTLLGSIIAGSVLFYNNHTVELPEKGGKYIEGLIGSVKHVNPVLLGNNDVDRDIAKLVFSGLFKTDSTGSTVPDLAESYSISEDQKTYTIVLRKDLKWDDGEALTIDDILFTIDTITDPELNSPLRYLFSDIEVTSIDDSTIQFVLKEPFAPFLSNLTVGIIPEHVWAEISVSNYQISELNQKPIGCGMYKFKLFEKDRSDFIKSYTLVRNEYYHGQSPYIDEITFKFYPSFDATLEAIHNGNVDATAYVPAQYTGSFEGDNSVVLHELTLPQYAALFMNPRKNKALQDKSVRQALSIALNKEQILNKALGKEGTIIHAPILPGYLGYHSKVKRYDYDPGYSEFLLEQSGWKKDGTKRINKNNEELNITLVVRDQEPMLAVADMVKKFWEAIGVTVNLQTIPRNKIQREIIKPRNYDALLFGQIVGADPDPYPFWHSSQTNDPGLALSIFANKDIDRLLEEARSTGDTTIRYGKYIEFQNLLSELAYAIFLYTPSYVYPQSSKIKGFSIERINEPADRFNDIEKWYIHTNKKWQS